jgi:Cu2+-exporting ATPase
MDDPHAHHRARRDRVEDAAEEGHSAPASGADDHRIHGDHAGPPIEHGRDEASEHAAHARGHHAMAGAAHAGHAAHDKHAGHSVAMFRDKFWLSLALTIPTLVWGHMLQSALGYHAPMFPGAMYIPAVFGTAVFAYGGWPFLQGAVRELKDRLPGMMTLIALAISVAFLFSAAVTVGYPGMPLWEELATLVTIMLLGHWIEMRSISQAQGALKELAKLLPGTATRVSGERTEDVPIDQLREGDVVLIRPGERVPADGAVVQGASAVNESMITGESRPVDKNEGDRVIAGTVNGSGSLRAKVTGTGERTTLAGIMRLVEQAQTSRSRAQAWSPSSYGWRSVRAIRPSPSSAWSRCSSSPARTRWGWRSRSSSRSRRRSARAADCSCATGAASRTRATSTRSSSTRPAH